MASVILDYVNGSIWNHFFPALIMQMQFANWYFRRNNFRIKGLVKYPKKSEITLCQTIMSPYIL